MSAKRYCVYISDKGLMKGLEAMVSAKGWSRNDVFRESLRTYLRQNAISSELAEFERRMAATYREQDRQMKLMRNDLQILMAFFDLFIRSYYVHTPSVPEETVDASASSAKLRYERLLKQVPKMFQGETGLMSVSASLDVTFDRQRRSDSARTDY